MADASIMKEDDESSILVTLMTACKSGNASAVEELLRAISDLDINQSNQFGETPFLQAASGGHLDVLKLLHSRGVQVNSKNQKGDSALHLAARNGHLPSVMFLVQNEADLNAENEHTETPLHASVVGGNVQVVDFLVRSDAKMEVQDQKGDTALHLACASRQSQVAMALLHLRSPMDIPNRTLETPLHLACREGMLSVVQTMCAFGCPVNVVDQMGMTPLHLAAISGDGDMVRYLLLSNADCNKMNKDEARPEEIANGHGHSEIGELLMNMRMNPSMGSALQLIPTNRPIGRVKVKIFGDSGVGKTTLIESLKCGYVRSFFRWHPATRDVVPKEKPTNPESRRRLFEEAPIHSNYTHGIDIQQVNIWGPGDVSFWEFSGYEPYHTAYDHFVGERHCIHLVVVNMNDTSQERLRQLHFWLNFIRSHMSPTEPIGFGGCQLWPARVIIIATHADEAQCAKNQKGEWEMEGKAALVNSLLKTFGADLLIVPHLYIMDANEAASVDMKHLRTMLYEMKNFIVQYLPPLLGMYDATVATLSSWAKVITNFPCVTWSVFVQYIRSKVNLLATDEHISELIRQLQLSGEIIYLQTNPDNEDIIVINPRWLCVDVLGTLMAHERIEDAPANGRLTLEYVRLLFADCEVTNIAALLEVLHLCVGCQVNDEILLDCPFLNALEKPEITQSPDSVFGGIVLVLTTGMEDQLLHIFPRIQTGFHRQLRQKMTDISLYQWGWGTRVQVTNNLEAVISLDKTTRHLEIKLSGPKSQRTALFSFQDSLCDVVFQILGECCPGMYTQWSPLSPLHVKDNQKNPHAYTSRAILLAQKDGETSLRLEPSAGIHEQLLDVVAYGSAEVFASMQAGFDLHVSSLSLYARYQLATLLDPTHPLGYDWCMLAISLGLSDVLPRLDVKEAAPLSKTDGILALWSRNQDATIRSLHDKLLQLERNDVVDTLLSLAPMFRYTPLDDDAAAKSRAGGQASQQPQLSPAQYALPKDGTLQTLPAHDAASAALGTPPSPTSSLQDTSPQDVDILIDGTDHPSLVPAESSEPSSKEVIPPQTNSVDDDTETHLEHSVIETGLKDTENKTESSESETHTDTE